MTTTINVVGTIATDPKLINPASGTTLCSFRLASDERRYDKEKQQWIDGDTNWFGVVAFRALATHAHESFRKGDRVIVSGRLKMRSWEKDERRGISVEIEADALGHDVRWGVSSFEKRVGSRQDTPAEFSPEIAVALGANPENSSEHQEADVPTNPEDSAPLAPESTPASIGWTAAAA